MTVDSFPRQSARTQNFSLGTPMAFAVAPDGRRVAFLRSRGGADRATCLWVVDVRADSNQLRERLVADPAVALAGGEEELTSEERARRERTRIGAAGIVEYATDEAVRIASFALSGRMFVAALDSTGTARELPATGPVLDPRPSPVGGHIAYVHNGTVRVIGTSGEDDRALAEPDAPDVTWGLAEFVAQEEMGRSRGYWWSPDGRRLLVARVDTSPVQRWHIGDPANPERDPAEVAYPAAGTSNAVVSLALVDLDGARVEVVWDAATFPYLVTAHWSAGGPPLLFMMSRDQRSAQTLAVDVDNGLTTPVASDIDDRWLEVVPGVPRWTTDGRLITIREAGGGGSRESERRVYVDGRPATSGLQVRGVLDVTPDDILIAASTDEPTEVHVFSVPLDGDTAAQRLSTEPGVHSGRRSGGLTVLTSTSLSWFGPKVRLLVDGKGEVGEIRSVAEVPTIMPSINIRMLGERALRGVVLYPDGHVPGSTMLPVVMDPYGGPHVQRVVAARNAYLTPQWIADQGFAVVIADGAGTPGRGPRWEREVFQDLAGPVLDDQVAALHAAAATHPDLDLSRVGIRGWSFGGYLAALAVLRRPDVFHAAIAGAPVTDWRLYDTFYTERYLGIPQINPEAYEQSSILTDAAKLSRPLMLIHGLADDNVVAAHSLRLSSALLAAGRSHTVLPLSGVTHMTPQEVVAENLLILQVEFLKSALAR